MSVHRSGPLTVTPNDLQTTHAGRHVALKLVAWDTASPKLVVVERKGAVWEANFVVQEFDDRNDGVPGYRYEAEIEEDGGVVNWIKKRILPLVNATLARMFLPSTEPPPPPGDLPVTLDGIDAGLHATLRWAPKSDGTLQVELA